MTTMTATAAIHPCVGTFSRGWRAEVRVTKSLSINAAFLQEIKDEHRHFRDLLKALRALCGNRLILRNHLDRLVCLLDEFRDQLALHFALEEAYGYFDDAIDVAPRLTTVAERLRAEHTVLFERLVGIADEADEVRRGRFSDTKVESLAESLRHFDDQLRDHERQETDLIHEALDRDIGGEG